MEGMIEITGYDLVKFAKKVYELSKPQGLGILHFKEGSLSDHAAHDIVDVCKDDKRIALSMDYVKGRACKMTVFRKDGNLWIRNSWFDHTQEQYAELIEYMDH